MQLFFFHSFGSYCLVRQFKKHRIGCSALFVCCTCYAAVSFMTFGMVFTSTSTATDERERIIFSRFYFPVAPQRGSVCDDQQLNHAKKRDHQKGGTKRRRARVCVCVCEDEVDAELPNGVLAYARTHTHTNTRHISSPAIIRSAATRRPPHHAVGCERDQPMAASPARALSQWRMDVARNLVLANIDGGMPSFSSSSYIPFLFVSFS